MYGHYTLTGNFVMYTLNILSKGVELYHITHRSFPHRCRQSSLPSGHTSSCDGCSPRFRTETLTQHMAGVSAGGFEQSHTTSASHPVRLCNQSARHRPCSWAGRHRTAHRRRNQQRSSSRKPRRSRRHSHPHHCIRNLSICIFCCGRQIHLCYTKHGLRRITSES